MTFDPKNAVSIESDSPKFDPKNAVALEKPAPVVGDGLSPEELVKGAGANIAQGMLFGAGGTIAGAGGVIGGQSANLVNRMRGTPVIPETVGQQFEEGRQAFEKPEKEFAKKYPKTSMVANIAGGLATGNALKVLPKLSIGKVLPPISKFLRSGAEGAVMGATYGAGSSTADVASHLLNRQKVTPALVEMGKGIATGATLGGAVGALSVPAVALSKGTAKTVGKMFFPKSTAGKTVENLANQDFGEVMQFPSQGEVSPIGFKVGQGAVAQKPMNQPPPSLGVSKVQPIRVVGGAVEDAPQIMGRPSESAKGEIPDSLIALARKEKKPLLDYAGFETRRIAQTAKLNSPEAEKILTKHAEATLEKNPSLVIKAVNNVLGNKSKFKNLDEIEKVYKTKAQPAYEKAFSYGDLAKHDPTIVDFLTQPKLINELKKARSSDLAIGLEDVPDTDIRILDIVKQNIDDQINKFLKGGSPEPNKARNLIELNNALKAKIDSVVPEYAQAREIASERFRLIDAQETASRIISSDSPEAVGRIMPTLTAPEREAFKIGIRDEIIKQIGKASKTERVNVALRIFGTTENYIGRQNLHSALGDADYNALMSEINPIVKSGISASELIGGSPTAQREAYKIPRSKTMFLKKLASKVAGSQTENYWTEVARIITDPKYLEKTFSKGAK